MTTSKHFAGTAGILIAMALALGIIIGELYSIHTDLEQMNHYLGGMGVTTD